MNRMWRVTASWVFSAALLAGLTACAGSDSNQQDDHTESVGEEISEAGQATGDAAEAVGEKTKQTAKNAAQKTSKTSQRAEKSIESAVGGGPVQSDTLKMLDTVDRETATYEDSIAQYGDQIDQKTRIRFDQIQHQADQLRDNYDQMRQRANLGVAELDTEYESQAEEIEDAWNNVENSLKDQLQNVDKSNR